ncbi:MAG: hypothetical protein KDK37_08980, partial [Leptospiraceae bacterium]|nr:hypothetical protein [Leptospiraceae bacterium]
MIRVATASVNQTPLDWSGNRNRIIAASQVAMQCNPDAILFPELCISGYGCEDAFHMPEVWSNSAESLRLLAEKLNGISGSVPVIVGLPYIHLGLLYNVSAVLSNGEIVALVPKQHLAGDGIHYEPRWFHPYRGAPEPAAEGILFGPSIIDTGSFRFIIEICEDSWVDNRPATQHAGSSFDCILSPTASHFAIGKERIRRQIALETSRAFHCTYISVNLLGNEAGRAIYDGQSIAAQTGNLLYESPAFSFDEFAVHCISFDPEPNRSRRVQTHSFRESITIPSHSSLESATVRISEARKDFGFRIPGEEAIAPSKEKEIPLPTDYCGPLSNPVHNLSSPERSDSQPLEKRHGDPNLEFLYAASLGLFDYLRKSHSRGFALSLSGGADSGVCALLVARMIRFGLAELGQERFLESIHRKDLGGLKGEEIIGNLLFTVYQGTDQSS